MKLATIANGTRDGQLVVVSRDTTRFAQAPSVNGSSTATMQQALDNWEGCASSLQALASALDSDRQMGQPVSRATFLAPLPRAYEWVDGSAYINHIVLVRKARNAEPPETLRTDPLVYQGGSSNFLASHDDIPLADASWGLDFEAEVCVVLGDTPQGVSAQEAGKYIRLVTICNDITLRNLIPAELAKGFGFFNSKPATAFAPFAVTPDELGDAWRDGRIYLRLRSEINDQLVGDTDAGPEMHFSFHDLIAHITKTRAYCAGTILGSGTVSNDDQARGISCLAERRMREIIAKGGAPATADTPFLAIGDRVRISMADEKGQNIFGTIEQAVVSGTAPAPGARQPAEHSA